MISDVVGNGILASITTGGVSAVAIWLWRLLILSGKREAAQSDLATAASKRATAEIERVNNAHDKELNELETRYDAMVLRLELKVEQLTVQVEELNRKWDAERDERRRVQDQYAQLVMKLGGVKDA
jgi:hypothetical protein